MDKTMAFPSDHSEFPGASRVLPAWCLAAATLGLVLMAGCSGGGQQEISPLIGKWEWDTERCLKALQPVDEESSNVNLEAVRQAMESMDMQFTFNEDGTMVTYTLAPGEEETVEGHYTIRNEAPNDMIVLFEKELPNGEMAYEEMRFEFVDTDHFKLSKLGASNASDPMAAMYFVRIPEPEPETGEEAADTAAEPADSGETTEAAGTESGKLTTPD